MRRGSDMERIIRIRIQSGRDRAVDRPSPFFLDRLCPDGALLERSRSHRSIRPSEVRAARRDVPRSIRVEMPAGELSGNQEVNQPGNRMGRCRTMAARRSTATAIGPIRSPVI